MNLDANDISHNLSASKHNMFPVTESVTTDYSALFKCPDYFNSINRWLSAGLPASHRQHSTNVRWSRCTVRSTGPLRAISLPSVYIWEEKNQLLVWNFKKYPNIEGLIIFHKVWDEPLQYQLLAFYFYLLNLISPNSANVVSVMISKKIKKRPLLVDFKSFFILFL